MWQNVVNVLGVLVVLLSLLLVGVSVLLVGVFERKLLSVRFENIQLKGKVYTLLSGRHKRQVQTAVVEPPCEEPEPEPEEWRFY